MGNGRLVHRQQAGADKLAAVITGIGWPHHPTVQHVRQPHVVHIGRFAGGLGRDIDTRSAGANQAVFGLRLERRIAGDR
ncbi:hypothetical protein D3C72_1812520 [compost metagenome]